MTYEQTPTSSAEVDIEAAETEPTLGFATYEELENFAKGHGFNTDPYKGMGLKVWNNFYKFSSYRDINGLYWRNSHNYDQFKPTIKPHYRDDKAIKSLDLYLPQASPHYEILKYVGPHSFDVQGLEDRLRQDPSYGLETRPIAEDFYKLNVDTLANIVMQGEDARLQMFGSKMWRLATVSSFS
ncbi:hypothetical protein KW794_03370, partial [Candidatus Saccharibacteria bacterium]|nr:hypothetical protein [Candidatus Saccharibacteria bacterium]